MLAFRGIVVTYETIRQWCLKFTPSFAKTLRKKQGALGDQWFLDGEHKIPGANLKKLRRNLHFRHLLFH